MKELKKAIITIISILLANVAYADSCIMITDYKINEVSCTDNSVISLNILTTLANEKRSIIVTSLKDGNCEFTIKLNKSNHKYKAVVENGKLKISGSGKIKILPVDLPPEILPKGE